MKATIVAITERSFDSFTTRDGQTVAAGKTFKAWVVEAFDSPPIAVKINAAQADELRAAGFAAEANLDVWLKPVAGQNGQARIEYQLDRDGLSVLV